VKQHFYVNDLGAQIGLTAVGFKRIYKKLKPTMKIDHWIGFIYAVMNTFTELEGMQVDPMKISELLHKGVEFDAVVEAIAQDMKTAGRTVDKEKVKFVA
jgi:arginyl-tRNA synthetase